MASQEAWNINTAMRSCATRDDRQSAKFRTACEKSTSNFIYCYTFKMRRRPHETCRTVIHLFITVRLHTTCPGNNTHYGQLSASTLHIRRRVATLRNGFHPSIIFTPNTIEERAPVSASHIEGTLSVHNQLANWQITGAKNTSWWLALFCPMNEEYDIEQCDNDTIESFIWTFFAGSAAECAYLLLHTLH